MISGCSEKKEFTIISDLELGETTADHPTVSSMKKAVNHMDVKLHFENTAIEKEADIINLVNTKKDRLWYRKK